jgi:hypothetical protein
VGVKRKRSIEPKEKVVTPAPLSKTPVAEGFPETTRATGSIIIVGEHIAKMWEANRTTGK